MKHLFSKCLVALMVFLVACSTVYKEQTGTDGIRLMQEGKVPEAIQVFEKLAAKGDEKAMIQLGIFYYQGKDVKQDYHKAMDWFLKAFSKQNADAFVNLGVMHRDGHGVPRNKKIAYCVFLTTHMSGLGTQSTQYRSNSCLRQILDDLTKHDVKDCLSNYTLEYIMAYLNAKGEMKGIPDKYKPSKNNPALRDLNWWLDGELDAIYGEPSEEEKKASQKKAEEREKVIEATRDTLVFQIRFPKDTANQYSSYDIITDKFIGSSPISDKKMKKSEKYDIYEDDHLIFADQHRHITIENKEGEVLVYEIDHPVKPSPSDWSKWLKPGYVLTDGMEKFTLLSGGKPRSKTNTIPVYSPEFRFKVVKK